jgi:gentisate 1,2-dioxygenase
MRNPSPLATYETSRTLVCAYQMILPGEHAPSHRHSSHALRVIIDGKGSYSIVDGEKTPMETGDVVLTPGWCWHGHGHDGDKPAYWFDGLDVPLTHLLEPMFFQEHPQKHEKVERVVQASPFRFTREDIARQLDAAKADGDGFHGPRVTLEAPSMPPIGLTMERLSSGDRTRCYRTTANTIFHVTEGVGETKVGNKRFSWTRGDTIVAPGWHGVSHRATSDAQLFAMSDEPLLRFSNYYRFEALD